MAFLAQYGLTKHFQLNIEPKHTTLAGHAAEHDIAMASAYGMLGSIDSNTGDPLLGWDTVQFPMDLQQATAMMCVLIQQGGFKTGGLNFDCKVQRESVDPADLFLGHIGAMDCYALGLRKAAEIHLDRTLRSMLNDRYLSWKSDMGMKIAGGKAALEDCTQYAKKKGEPLLTSSKQELYEIVRNRRCSKYCCRSEHRESRKEIEQRTLVIDYGLV